MFATGETVGLAEWIIDDTCLVSSLFPKLCHHSFKPDALTGLKEDKTEVINDPLGQPTVLAGSDYPLMSKFWDGRTICVKIVIATGQDCGRPCGSKSCCALTAKSKKSG